MNARNKPKTIDLMRINTMHIVYHAHRIKDNIYIDMQAGRNLLPKLLVVQTTNFYPSEIKCKERHL